MLNFILVTCALLYQSSAQSSPGSELHPADLVASHARALKVAAQNGIESRSSLITASESSADLEFLASLGEDGRPMGVRYDARRRELSVLRYATLGEDTAWTLSANGVPGGAVHFRRHEPWQVQVVFGVGGADDSISVLGRDGPGGSVRRTDVERLMGLRSFIVWAEASGQVEINKGKNYWHGRWDRKVGPPPVPGLELHPAFQFYVTEVRVAVVWSRTSIFCSMQEFCSSDVLLRASTVVTNSERGSSTTTASLYGPASGLSPVTIQEFRRPLESDQAQAILDGFLMGLNGTVVTDSRVPGKIVTYDLGEDGLWSLERVHESIQEEEDAK